MSLSFGFMFLQQCHECFEAEGGDEVGKVHLV